ncbi:MAG: hypothetical protein M1835_004279 [Candelina submexicana]|nr:MAG: hypothetical protein M1835_004279 [Candelina submexicana]
MDFAPYQDQSPETARTLSPPPQGERRSRSFSPYQRSTPVHPPGTLSPPSHYSDEESRLASNGSHGSSGDFEDTRAHISQFETSLPLRLDYEAMLAYLILPPAGGVFLLLVEHKSDYVRYVQKLGTGRKLPLSVQHFEWLQRVDGLRM